MYSSRRVVFALVKRLDEEIESCLSSISLQASPIQKILDVQAHKIGVSPYSQHPRNVRKLLGGVVSSDHLQMESGIWQVNQTGSANFPHYFNSAKAKTD